MQHARLINKDIRLPNEIYRSSIDFPKYNTLITWTYDLENFMWVNSNIELHFSLFQKDTSDELAKKHHPEKIGSLLKEVEILRELSQADQPLEQMNSDCIAQLNSNDNLILRTLINTANRNVLRVNAGYRHEELMKAFAGYIKMISGTLAYETLHANLPLVWPSSTTASRFIYDNRPMMMTEIFLSEFPCQRMQHEFRQRCAMIPKLTN